MTQKQEFAKAMKSKGFKVSDFGGHPFMGTLDLIPCHRKTTEGHHNIISKIVFVMFGGSNVVEGDLGCVTFYHHGKQRKKYRKNVSTSEILKKSFCPKTAKEALQTFDIWNMESNKTINTWKVIL